MHTPAHTEQEKLTHRRGGKRENWREMATHTSKQWRTGE